MYIQKENLKLQWSVSFCTVKFHESFVHISQTFPMKQVFERGVLLGYWNILEPPCKTNTSAE